MKTVAIIPARGGSKRIPGKNIRNFFGKPMLQYSIDACLNSGVIDRIIVSTDSPEIAEIAARAGAEVPGLRPAALSDDHTPLANVVSHAVTHWVGDLADFPYICCVLATAPFLQAKYLREGLARIRDKKAATTMSVTSFEFPIFRAMKTTPEGKLEWVWPEYEMVRSNDLPETFHDAGQFYWLDTEKFMASQRVIMPDCCPVRLPRHLTQDIDTPEDWEMAEALYRSLLPRV